MHALRIIETDGREASLFLGDHFTLTKFEYMNNEAFNRKFAEYYGSGGGEERYTVSAFIDAGTFPISLPLYHAKEYYIVTLDGIVSQKLDLNVPPQPINLPKEVAISLGIIKE